MSVHAAEMTGGYYTVEISAITAGGGAAEDSGNVRALWGAVAQPLAQGKMSGGGYNLFGGVYTPVIPEVTTALLALLGLAIVRRRR